MDCLILKTLPFERNAPEGECFDFRAFASCQNGESYNEAGGTCAFYVDRPIFAKCGTRTPCCSLAVIQYFGL